MSGVLVEFGDRDKPAKVVGVRIRLGEKHTELAESLVVAAVGNKHAGLRIGAESAFQMWCIAAYHCVGDRSPVVAGAFEALYLLEYCCHLAEMLVGEHQ